MMCLHILLYLKDEEASHLNLNTEKSNAAIFVLKEGLSEFCLYADLIIRFSDVLDVEVIVIYWNVVNSCSSQRLLSVPLFKR